MSLFFLGKLTSWFVYQTCWQNALGRDLTYGSATGLLVTRFKLWPIHAIWLISTLSVTWADFPELRAFAAIVVATLTWGAVFRFGAADVGNFFWLDRLLAITFCVGVYFSPAFLYPAILLSCSLQYTVSAWKLGPGYSNLLGFEFIRGTSCVILACVAFAGALSFTGRAIEEPGSIFLFVIVGVQASHYFNHGLAKVFLGRRWYSWATKNRLECLVVNSYLRGWRLFRCKTSVLRFARWIRRFRVPLCLSVLVFEVGFVFVFVDLRVAGLFFVAAIAFHLTVWILTGLAEIEYLINHSTILVLLFVGPSIDESNQLGWRITGILAGCLVVNFLWVGWIRSRMLGELQSSGQTQNRSFADSFDHLMAWWDSPYMRMYTYIVVAEDGSRYQLPVPKLSPYDTALTDIHTHIMIMNAHEGFDPQASSDKQIARTGVWGLVITEQERDFLYDLMDQETPDFSRLNSGNVAAPWTCDGSGNSHGQAEPLRQLFQGINRFQDRHWLRLLMRYPHFPGEDLVPDICPIAEDQLPIFRFDQPIQSVEIQRIKTIYTGDDLELIERSVLGTIRCSR